MKQLLLIVFLLSSSMLFCSSCNKEQNERETVYKGRLEIKGLCGNYTVKILDGNIDPNLIQSIWTNPNTNITYQNVFRLSNPCALPTNIEEGAEFYFQLQNKNEGCVQCKAYYPTPTKSLEIKITDKSCNKPTN